VDGARVNGDVKAIRTPTGYIPLYEDLRKLFLEVLGKEYTRADYDAQFTIRVPENLEKIERVLKFYRDVTDTPSELTDILLDQRERLLDAQRQFGDYILPEKFEASE
jgi:phosphoenolpyruvate carboxykinase (GTP)